MKTFDPTKPVQTRAGRKVRILCTDRKGTSYPIVALVTYDDGEESLDSYTAEGRVYVDGSGEDIDDLTNLPTAADDVYDWIMAQSHVRDALRAFHATNQKITGIKFLRSIVPATIDRDYIPREGVAVGCGLVAAKAAYERFVASRHIYA